MKRLYTWIYYKLIIYGIIRSRKKNYFISRVKNNAKWAYISYIPEVLCGNISIKEMRKHQNMQEQIAMVKCFNSMGYNVFVQAYYIEPIFPNIDVEIIFGLEPVFEKACMHYPNAKKIYYATGAYYEFQNNQVQRMTDYVNLKCNSNLPYRRLVKPHQSAKLADDILQIGSKFTIETYPEYLRNKIKCIHQSTQDFSIPKIKYAKENEFLFVASEGNVLKGSFLLLEYFSKHPEYTLHWVGPLEDDFRSVVSVYITNNIKTYGFLDWESDTMKKIVARCNYIIYASGSEGSPGAVLCAMKCGLIPIVSYPSAFDEIDSYGFIIPEFSCDDIENAVIKSVMLNEHEVLKLKRNCSEYIQQTYSLMRFSNEFMFFLNTLVKK